MREAVKRLGGDTAKVNPLSPVDLVIDHSVTVIVLVMIRHLKTYRLEMERNHERYVSLKWGKQAFSRLASCRQAQAFAIRLTSNISAKQCGANCRTVNEFCYPDTLVGTDSHTTMINGLRVLGWGVGGIEAEAAMLGQPVSMLIPDVVGFKPENYVKVLPPRLVLTVTQMLRKHGVVGKFVEFYGDGLDSLPLADRTTVANMSPEYGATCGFFPIDAVTLDYMR
ncbi:aconitase family protein [Shigella flexneri]